MCFDANLLIQAFMFFIWQTHFIILQIVIIN